MARPNILDKSLMQIDSLLVVLIFTLWSDQLNFIFWHVTYMIYLHEMDGKSCCGQMVCNVQTLNHRHKFFFYFCWGKENYRRSFEFLNLQYDAFMHILETSFFFSGTAALQRALQNHMPTIVAESFVVPLSFFSCGTWSLWNVLWFLLFLSFQNLVQLPADNFPPFKRYFLRFNINKSIFGDTTCCLSFGEWMYRCLFATDTDVRKSIS